MSITQPLNNLVLHFDQGKIFHTKESPEGFLYLWVASSKEGPLKYYKADGTARVEDVPYKTLSDPKYIASLVGKPITDDHPRQGMISKVDAGHLGKGTILDTYLLDKEYLNNLAVIHDGGLIAKILDDGKREVSAGYWAQVKKDSNGNYYQASRQANHVAIVDKARAQGARVRIDGEGEGEDPIVWIADSIDLSNERSDYFKDCILRQNDELPIIIDLGNKPAKRSNSQSKEGGGKAMNNQIVIKTDGVSQVFQVDDMQLAEAIKSLIVKCDELEEEAQALDEKNAEALINAENNKKSNEEELEAVSAERDVAIAQRDTLQVKFEEATTPKLDGDEISAEVGARLDTWKLVLPELRKDDASFVPDYKLDSTEIKQLYLERRRPSLDFNGKSPEYVNALWDGLKPEHVDSDEEAVSRTDSQLDSHFDRQGQGMVGRSQREKRKPQDFLGERDEDAKRIEKNGVTYLNRS